MSKNCFRFLILVFLLFTIFSCVSKTTSLPEQEPSIEKPKIKKYPEEKLPKYPFINNSEYSMYIKDRSIIEKFAEQFNIKSIFIIAQIDRVYVSKLDTTYLLAIQLTDSRSFNDKINILKSTRAQPLKDNAEEKSNDTINEDTRYWILDNNYIDLGYLDTILISNEDFRSQEKIFGWEIPKSLQSYIETKELDMWLWSNAEEFVGQFKAEKIVINWAAIIIKDYINREDVLISLALNYNGSKEVRATIKLLVPLLIKSISGLNLLSSLPDLQVLDDSLIIDGLKIDENNFWKYLEVNQDAATNSTKQRDNF